MMHEWADYFMATAGGAAALTGLIFVGVSISLTKILSIPNLSNRALGSLALLMNILIVSSLGLIPGQPLQLLGIEILACSIILWLFVARLDYTLIKHADKAYKYFYVRNMIMSQVATLPYVVSGIIILTIGPVGLYILVPAIILSFLKSLLDAWVLLIEINR